jgi:hypothetical protein
MKLLRHGSSGSENPAQSAEDSSIQDLSSVISNINDQRISPMVLKNCMN